MTFRFHKLQIPGLVLIEAHNFQDERGCFREIYKASLFSSNMISPVFVQDNFSYSKYGTLRGLHYQMLPKAQGKLVTVLDGQVFDVAVDIRRGSPNYGQWIGETLSRDNARMLYIPPGFAHGFCVVSEQATVLYKVTEEFAPQLERGICWNDPELSIQWPVLQPLLSERDARLPRLKEADINFSYV